MRDSFTLNVHIALDSFAWDLQQEYWSYWSLLWCRHLPMRNWTETTVKHISNNSHSQKLNTVVPKLFSPRTPLISYQASQTPFISSTTCTPLTTWKCLCQHNLECMVHVRSPWAEDAILRTWCPPGSKSPGTLSQRVPALVQVVDPCITHGRSPGFWGLHFGNH